MGIIKVDSMYIAPFPTTHSGNTGSKKLSIFPHKKESHVGLKRDFSIVSAHDQRKRLSSFLC